MPMTNTKVFIEVVEIYPNLQFRLPKKLKEQGTCHIVLTIGEISMDIKNIRYQLRKNGGVWIGPPINVYPDPTRKENRKVSVPTITFKDPEIFEKIRETLKKELLEDS